MQSVRRIAVRNAVAFARQAAPAPKNQIASLPSQLGSRSVASQRAWAVPASRFFSQTARAANEAEEKAESQLVDEAVKAAEEQTTDVGASSDAASGLRPGETPYGIFVRNLVFDVNEKHLEEAFEKYGKVEHTVIVRDTRGLSRGFGFVYFNNPDDMNTAAAQANGSFWNGRRLGVLPRLAGNRKAKREPREPTTSVYIGNIPYEATDAELNRIFRGLENVTDVRVAVDRTTGWPRGFAHADFVDVDSAIKAVAKLSGMQIGGRDLHTDYATPVDMKKRK